MSRQHDTPSTSIRSWAVLTRLVARYRAHWPSVLGAVVVLAIWSGLEMWVPALVGEAIGILLPYHASAQALPTAFTELLGLLVVIYAVKLMLHYGVDVWLGAIGQRMENALRHELFTHVLRLRFRYHDENRSGETIARSLRDMERARHFYREVAFGYAELALLALACIAMSFWLHPVYGVIVGSAVVVALILIATAGRRIARMDKVADDQYDEVTTALQENVAGARVVRAFGREDAESDKFGDRLSSFTDKWAALERYWTSRLPLFGNVYRLAIPAVLVACTWRIAHGVGSLAEGATAYFYLGLIAHRMRPLTRLVIMGQTAVASATRVFEVLDHDQVMPEPRDVKPLPPRGGALKLVDVWFSHPDAPPVLRGVNLEVAAGGSLGIIGTTGSGKSSLVQLLPRFYDVDRGCILLDGVDVRDLDVTELRSEVGIVFQEPFLFSATVAENIAYGRPDVTRLDIERCADLAAATDFVQGLPQGFDTIVGERGVSLSGGQRQRLTIARALARDPRLLIFDDATAAVDAITEKVLFDGIRAAAQGRTTLVISQRVTSVRWCDRIAVLDRGEVTAVGPHDALVHESALYREIWEHQRLETATA